MTAAEFLSMLATRGVVVDADLLQALAAINGTLSDLGKSVAAVGAEAKQANYRAARLEAAVFGSAPPSDPPPPSPGKDDDAGSDGVAEVTVIKPPALAFRVKTSEERASALEARVASIETMTTAQCKVMGVPTSPPESAAPSALEKVATFAMSREGRNFAIRFLTLVIATLGALQALRAHDAASATHEALTPPPVVVDSPRGVKP